MVTRKSTPGYSSFGGIDTGLEFTQRPRLLQMRRSRCRKRWPLQPQQAAVRDSPRRRHLIRPHPGSSPSMRRKSCFAVRVAPVSLLSREFAISSTVPPLRLSRHSAALIRDKRPDPPDNTRQPVESPLSATCVLFFPRNANFGPSLWTTSHSASVIGRPLEPLQHDRSGAACKPRTLPAASRAPGMTRPAGMMMKTGNPPPHRPGVHHATEMKPGTLSVHRLAVHQHTYRITPAGSRSSAGRAPDSSTERGQGQRDAITIAPVFTAG